LGLGFDLGLTYYPKEHSVTASILDVGFIKHSKDVETFTYKGYYKYEGTPILIVLTPQQRLSAV
jgi:hypothetical protein